MAEAVIRGALVHIREHGIGFTAFFEFLFCGGVVWISVGMMLQRQLTIGALQLDFRGSAADAEYLVVVTFCVGWQLLGSSFTSWNFLRHAPSPDATGGLSICIRAAIRPAHDCL